MIRRFFPCSKLAFMTASGLAEESSKKVIPAPPLVDIPAIRHGAEEAPTKTGREIRFKLVLQFIPKAEGFFRG